MAILANIERRCCWWNCGPSNTVSTYNGIETYFCTGQKCNGYGAESALGAPGKNESKSPQRNIFLMFGN